MRGNIFLFLIAAVVISSASAIRCYTCTKCQKKDDGELKECGLNVKTCVSMYDSLSNSYTRGCSSKGNCPPFSPNEQDRCEVCSLDSCNHNIETVTCLACADEEPNGDCSKKLNFAQTECSAPNKCYYKSYKVNDEILTVRGCASATVCLQQDWLQFSNTIRNLEGEVACNTCKEAECNSRVFNGAVSILLNTTTKIVSLLLLAHRGLTHTLQA